MRQTWPAAGQGYRRAHGPSTRLNDSCLKQARRAVSSSASADKAGARANEVLDSLRATSAEALTLANYVNGPPCRLCMAKPATRNPCHKQWQNALLLVEALRGCRCLGHFGHMVHVLMLLSRDNERESKAEDKHVKPEYA